MGCPRVKTALCHGCFDVLHIGHVRLLRRAHELAERVIVSLLSDSYVTKWKGPSRPCFPLATRIETIRALRYVDDVVVVDGPTHEDVERMIAGVAPDIYVKGADCIGRLPEQDFCERMGIKVQFVELAIFNSAKASSTQALRQFVEMYS